jgi:hypothetical protein
LRRGTSATLVWVREGGRSMSLSHFEKHQQSIGESAFGVRPLNDVTTEGEKSLGKVFYDVNVLVYTGYHSWCRSKSGCQRRAFRRSTGG